MCKTLTQERVIILVFLLFKSPRLTADVCNFQCLRHVLQPAPAVVRQQKRLLALLFLVFSLDSHGQRRRSSTDSFCSSRASSTDSCCSSRTGSTDGCCSSNTSSTDSCCSSGTSSTNSCCSSGTSSTDSFCSCGRRSRRRLGVRKSSSRGCRRASCSSLGGGKRLDSTRCHSEAKARALHARPYE